MDSSVSTFYTKNADQGYIDQYEKDHGPRLDDLVNHFKLKDLNQRVLDVGGGLGFLGKRLGLTSDYTVVDGAKVPEEKRVCRGTYYQTDLDYHKFGDDDGDNGLTRKAWPWDMAFCLETLEHCTNPYNVLAEMKKLVKGDGHIYLSIPHANVWHNYIYPALMIERTNFEQFLGQMALPVIEYKLWDKGWNAHTWKLRNADWTEAHMLYPKQEIKFYGKTPLEYVNL